jgi:phage baseplate assembly protein gpV/phage protein D
VVGVALDFDGAPAAAPLTASLSEIEVRQELNAPSMALLTFLDAPSDAAGCLAMGVRLSLRAPDGSALFDGEITGLRRSLNGSRERSLSVRAYDRLHRLRKRQSLRDLSDTGLSEFAALVAGDLGVTVDAGDCGQPRRVIIQQDHSDFGMLAELAADAGRAFWLDGEELRLLSLGGDGEAEAILRPGENVLEFASDITAEPMRKKCSAFGWELSSNQVHTAQVGLASQDALEMRLDAVSAFEGLGDRFLVNRVCETADEAQRIAQGDMDFATARGLKVDALCEGDPSLRPGRVIRIEGIGSETDGPFVVASATHRFDGHSGYTTRVRTSPPATTRSRGVAVTLAVVTDTDDPESRSRVKAKFPLFGDVTGNWMPVLSIGAGKSKGFTIIPEVGDEVLVLLPDGDPARGIVLGGLYGGNAALGERPAEGARSFVLRSPSGPQLTFDGGKSLVRIESGDGEMIEMGPDGTLFRAMRDMTIEAPGHTLKIRAAKVDFERA